ncbi:aminoglycoside phosphotransferase family protein [Jidongwangia harbinensis]|uniref:aminoglycoside phosphotransferase family protein n=1 Tax=Jidongwangia harbinensis TaxID=2878561 RepID=UPI001CDA371A|nr:aminoglycoside phosphotransferase family protein [Jidongwangia harbinensis]MCA2214319.1 aminoglycoside phosphotransferase family protein [Jidongwangia harbinensis]
MSVTVPPVLARNVGENWGDQGRDWLARLPALLDDVTAGWQLTAGPTYPLSFSWVLPVTRADGTPAVLKLGVPGPDLAHQEEALRVYDGSGAVRLLAADPVRGALLLERAEPGTPATALVPEQDESATAVLIGAARRLHRAPPAGCTLPDLHTEVSRSFRTHLGRFPGDDPLPRRIVQHAADLFGDLCADAPERLVLHGDLHHDNVLRAEREPWLAIDPHGVVGDPGYDCGAMLYNPEPDRREDGLLKLVPARVEQLADGFGLPVERVVAWGFVVGVLSEVWTAEGGTPGSRAWDTAMLLRPRLTGAAR